MLNAVDAAPNTGQPSIGGKTGQLLIGDPHPCRFIPGHNPVSAATSYISSYLLMPKPYHIWEGFGMSNNRDLVSNNALSPTIAHEVHCRAIVLHDGRNAIDISHGIAKCILRNSTTENTCSAERRSAQKQKRRRVHRQGRRALQTDHGAVVWQSPQLMVEAFGLNARR